MTAMLNPTAPRPPALSLSARPRGLPQPAPASPVATLPSMASSATLPAFSGWQAPRRHPAVAALVLVLHLVLLAALMQAGWRAVRPVPAPVVSLSLMPPAAAPQPAAALAQPAAVPRAPLAWQPLPVPSLSLSLSLSLSELPAATTNTTTTTVSTSPAQTAAPAAAPTPTPDAAVARLSPATPVATPKAVPAGSLRYRVEPAVEVPRLSRRAGEQGQVQLRVVFDTEGRPRDIQLARSSGFARLDAQACEAMQVARIAPYLEDGRPIEVVAVATLLYELQ
jgi:periplasmic protein TonB